MSNNELIKLLNDKAFPEAVEAELRYIRLTFPLKSKWRSLLDKLDEISPSFIINEMKLIINKKSSLSYSMRQFIVFIIYKSKQS